MRFVLNKDKLYTTSTTHLIEQLQFRYVIVMCAFTKEVGFCFYDSLDHDSEIKKDHRYVHILVCIEKYP